MHHMSSRIRTSVRVAAVVVGACLALSGCTDASKTDTSSSSDSKSNSEGVTFNLSPDQDRIVPAKVDSIAAKVPEAIRAAGVLKIGTGGGSTGFPPLVMTATDNKTVIGLEADLSTLIAGVLGLNLELENTSFENLAIGVESGKYTLALSNISITESRKQKFDFASIRMDGSYFEVLRSSGKTIEKPEDAAGMSIAVTPGTIQDKTLLDWNTTLAGKGLAAIDIKYFPSSSDALIALQSARIDAYLTNSATVTYRSTLPDGQTANGSNQLVGSALVGAMSLKDSGMAEPVSEAINSVIKSGEYQKVLERWGLGATAIDASVVNPPGLNL